VSAPFPALATARTGRNASRPIREVKGCFGSATLRLWRVHRGRVECRPVERNTEFVALGHAGSEHYAGLESFPNPGVSEVDMTSDELTAVCPITGQPDFYTAKIVYRPDALCLESKSLKLYLAQFRNEGAFGEALAVRIRDDVAAALQLDPPAVTVTLTQKPRGGITITATA
jgi:7-cyano-7-deazaguanine reductase